MPGAINPVELLPFVGQGINAISQGTQNRANRRAADRMDWRHRMWALEDWKMQNEYNSPAAQMQRLKDAGLNPNLVYGHGATAMSPGMPRSSGGSPAMGEAPRVDFGQALSQIYGNRVRQQQVDNMKKQWEILGEQKMLTMAKTAESLANTALTGKKGEMLGKELAIKDQLQRFQLEAAELSNIQKYADIQYKLDENARRHALTGRNIIESVERVLNYEISREKSSMEIAKLQQEINNLKKDGRIKEFSADLADRGINPNQPGFIKAVEAVIDYLKDKSKNRRYPYLGGDETDSFGRPR